MALFLRKTAHEELEESQRKKLFAYLRVLRGRFSFAKTRIGFVRQPGEQRFHMLPGLPPASAIGGLYAFLPHSPGLFNPLLLDQRGAEHLIGRSVIGFDANDVA